MLILLIVIGASGCIATRAMVTGWRRRRPDLAALTPPAFERAIGAWLARDGWLVDQRGGSGDEGIDLVAFRGGDVVVLQCKRYGPSNPVTPAQVRELYGAAAAVGATVAVMVTTGRVSSAAVAWAAKLPADGPALLFRNGTDLHSLRQNRAKLLA